jgi:hypothetical protein
MMMMVKMRNDIKYISLMDGSEENNKTTLQSILNRQAGNVECQAGH